MRVLFTGGSGKAGRHVIPFLQDCGHWVVNLDRVPSGLPDTAELLVDLCDSGQVFGAMTQWADFDGLEGPVLPYDAIVHFAAVPRILIGTDGACFQANVTSTYNVIEAAVKLGIKKVIIASSETTYGVCFAQGEVKPQYVPVDEDHPTLPHDSYGMSKVCNEATARSFQARSGIDIYALRINNVIEPDEYDELFPKFVKNPALRRRNIFGFIDARDLGLMVDCCLEADGLGYQVFNVANDESSVAIPTSEVMEQFYEGVPMRRKMAEYQSFYSNTKAREMLGFEPQYEWRNETA